MQKEIIEECTIDHLEVEVQKCLRRLIEMENRVRRANRGGIQDSRYLLLFKKYLIIILSYIL